ncbi:MAG: TadE family protein [Bryobacteraceae bacterium]
MIASRRHRSAPRRATAGHAMIELAVAIGVLVTFLAGTFQFGYTFYMYNQLVSAVGNGARYAAQRTYRAASDEDIKKGEAAIRNMVVYGDSRPVPEALPVVPRLRPEQVIIEWVKRGDGKPSAVDISIKGYTVNAMFKSFTFDGRPSVEFPYVGLYAPAESEQ